MKTERIADANMVLAIIIRDSDWEKGLNFVSSDEDYQQVGTWIYDKGKNLSSHIHLDALRSVNRTQEVLYVKSGRLRANIYNEERMFLASVDLNRGDTAIFLYGGHGYEILDDDTRVLEIKNGPYVGVEKDRERF